MEFYLTTDEAWEKMFDDCAKARRSIDIEQYIIEDDEVGGRFLTVLSEKAQQGVRVRIVADAVGSRSLERSKALETLKKAGGQVVFYHPLWRIHVLFPWLWFPRNHCKVLMIDGSIVHLGGICVASYMRGWRDTQIRTTGPLAQKLQQDYSRLWARLNRKQVDTCETYHAEFPIETIIQQPFFGRRPFYRELLKRINTAQDYIYLVTPYFFPPYRLRRALYRAVKRGVKVSVMLSYQTDVRLADRVTRALLGRWLRKGVHILFYRPTVLHAKYIVIDGKWGSIGSVNFDHMSLRFNREANIIFHDEAHIAMLLTHFQADAAHCTVATLDEWRRQSLWGKVVGFFGAQLHKSM